MTGRRRGVRRANSHLTIGAVRITCSDASDRLVLTETCSRRTAFFARYASARVTSSIIASYDSPRGVAPGDDPVKHPDHSAAVGPRVERVGGGARQFQARCHVVEQQQVAAQRFVDELPAARSDS